MAVYQLGSASARRSPCRRRCSGLAMIVLLLGVLLATDRLASAAGVRKTRTNPRQADTSMAARQNAVRSIPFTQLDDMAKAKVRSVLSDVTVFRRMPVQVIDCDPDLYLFLVRHPDVVVNIWEVLKLGNVKLRQTGNDTYRVVEAIGTLANMEFLYSSPETHVVYAEGIYEGPLFARPVRGRALVVLKSGYVRETNGRYYVTTRLDTFVRIDHGGVELLTKTFHPLVGRTADANFIQSMAFLGSLSRTAEVNGLGVRRLASRLTHVLPENRVRLAELATNIAEKAAATQAGRTPNPIRVAAGTRQGAGS